MLLWSLQTYLYSSEFYLLSLLNVGEASFDVSFYQDFTDTCFNELGIEGVEMNLTLHNKKFEFPLTTLDNFDINSIYLYVRTNAINLSVYKIIDGYCDASKVSFNSLTFRLLDNVSLTGFECEHPLIFDSILEVGDLDVTSLNWNTKRLLTVSSLAAIESLKEDFTGIPFQVEVYFNGAEWEKSALKELLTYDSASLIKINMRSISSVEVFDDYVNIILEYGKRSETQEKDFEIDKSIITNYIFMDEDFTSLSIEHLEKMCALRSIFTRVKEWGKL